jgi:predicted transport protein
MKLYSIQDKTKLKPVSNIKFDLEKEIQVLFEKNLEELFNLQFVKSEFSIKNFRIDTLGYDNENKSFVIIEYKKDRNFSVIDQGYTYMSLMLNNKSDFILEYNENCGGILKRDDIDWTQSKVIFVSPHFTEYQKHSINFKDVPFELWEVKKYENSMIGLVQHKTTSDESISSISDDKSNVVNQVSREVKVYTEEYHFKKNIRRDEKVVDLYNELKDRILNLGEVEIIPRKEYIGFRKKRPFCDVVFYTDHLRILVNLKKGQLDDPKNLTKDMSSQGHWGNGDYELRLSPNDELDYVMFLITQSYKKQD